MKSLAAGAVRRRILSGLDLATSVGLSCCANALVSVSNEVAEVAPVYESE